MTVCEVRSRTWPQMALTAKFTKHDRFKEFQMSFYCSKINTILENHCTRTAQSSREGCSRRGHKIGYLAVNKGIFFNFFYFLKFLSLIIITYKSSCVSALPIFCGLCDMPKMCFFLTKRMKEIFAYVLEFMLTFVKMQNTSPLMCIDFEI